jgi:transposase InsO family protein
MSLCPRSSRRSASVQRNFTAQCPDQVWVTDITEHPTAWFPGVVATLLVRGVCDAGEEVQRRAA